MISQHCYRFKTNRPVGWLHYPGNICCQSELRWEQRKRSSSTALRFQINKRLYRCSSSPFQSTGEEKVPNGHLQWLKTFKYGNTRTYSSTVFISFTFLQTSDRSATTPKYEHWWFYSRLDSSYNINKKKKSTALSVHSGLFFPSFFSFSFFLKNEEVVSHWKRDMDADMEIQVCICNTNIINII